MKSGTQPGWMPADRRGRYTTGSLMQEFRSPRRVLGFPIWVVLAVLPMPAQVPSNQGALKDTMAKDYTTAQQALAAREFAPATAAYERFVAEALRRLAARWAVAGNLARSVSLLEEATTLTPNDMKLQLDYAGACQASGDLPKAKALAESVLALEPRNAKAYLELGRTLSQMGEGVAATSALEKAVAIDANFENGYALAMEYLKRKMPQQATKVFVEMQSGLGDLAELHMKLGDAYTEAGYPEKGIVEFKKALAKNEKIRGGHYALGASYLRGLGNAVQNQAEKEFQKELKNYPDDPLSLYQLGNIEFNRHELGAAERDLNRSRSLDDSNADTYLVLGEIYNETGHASDAEAVLRKSIALTVDVARNNYQVQRAHYLLGRLLLQDGRREEAQSEMETAGRLQKESIAATQGLTSAASSPTSQSSARPTQESLREAASFESKIKDAVADSYNNLGAMAAADRNFTVALRDFREAAKWNPSLETLDSNWGRAAFSSGDYEQAIGPLSRYLTTDPSDDWSRAALGSSYFSLQRYRDAVDSLRPIESLLMDRPQLCYIYAVSEIKTGASEAGISRLLALEKANPDVAVIPTALADAYASMGEIDKAEQQKQIAKMIAGKLAGRASQKPN